MTKISFVCPIYNKINYLSQVLNSIKKQVGNFEKEYFFVNDGSTDGSLDFLKKKTKHWKNTKIFNQENKGPAIATQLAIKHSKGDFIKLIGGDDIMTPDCTKILLDGIKKTNSVAIFSRYKLIKNLKDIFFKKQIMTNIKTIKNPLEETVRSNYSGTTPNLYCNKAIKKSGGCNQKLFIEDFSLVLGISKYGSFSFIDNITTFGPKNDENRIMTGKKTQLIHDYNAALYYFLNDNDNIEHKIKKIACKKAIGRAEKWSRRILKKSIFNQMNLLKIKFYLRERNLSQIIKKTCLYISNNVSDKEVRYKVS